MRHYTVNACLAPLCSLHGLAVTTVEGIGSTKTTLHPVQERIAMSHGSQCGFCTPGIVMSMYTLLRNNPQPSRSQLEKAFQGNLCRCTGYRPILDGFNTFTKEFACPMGDQCCRIKGSGQSSETTDRRTDDVIMNASVSLMKPVALTAHNDFKPYDSTQEPIFPSELQLNRNYDNTSVVFAGERSTWYRPTTLNELLELKTRFPQAKLVGGNTEIGVEIKFKKQVYPVMIAVSQIDELCAVRWKDEGVAIGASVTLTQLEETARGTVRAMGSNKTRVFTAILDMLQWFAGEQIRNVAIVAGNIMTASPISDLNPLFMAAGCTLTFVSRNKGKRKVVMDEKFFTAYRRTNVSDDEVLLSVLIPYSSENEYFCGYKQAQRREDDISIVNAGMKVTFKPGSDIISDIHLAFGGMAPTTVFAKKTQAALHDSHWDDTMLCRASDMLATEMALPGGTPGGQEAYRTALTLSFFYRFYISVKLDLYSLGLSSAVASEDRSAAHLIERETSYGCQMFEQVSPDQPEYDLVGRPRAHLAAFRQATGEAQYLDDITKTEGELYLAMVTSRKAHVHIVKVDTSTALGMSGVVAYIDHTDVPGTNVTGSIVKDELVFAEDEVTCEGQIIGAIVADTQTHAQRAANEVVVQYSDLKPIITIEEAIKAESLYTQNRQIMVKGDVEVGFQSCDHIVEGEVQMGSQEQFYLETQASLVIPKEDGEIEVISSSQSPSEGQMYVADVLAVPGNRVTFRTKRLGGGFGGKQTNFKLVTLPAAVAAVKLNKPVRCMLDRDEDMVITGKRNPILAKYKIGFNKDGTIVAVQLDIFANGGNSLDMSGPAVQKALLVLENCYRIQHVKARTFVCRTNIPSNTAFRGFGGPQGMFICESWLSHVAHVLNVRPEMVREKNMLQQGDSTYYGHRLDQCTIEDCYYQAMESCNFHQLRKDVDDFNAQNRWKKRGLAVVPTKFGISYAETFLNQAGALVHIYLDGSVLIAHSGVEMGQGLHTKMTQVASRVLGIPASRIHISETTTMTVPNTTPTAASCTSDMNGMAIKNACEILLDRLNPYKEKNPTGTWESWIKDAFFDRVSLSATGFFRTPEIQWSWVTKKGKPYAYYSYGACVSLVEIDCLTGDHTVLRTDIVMDVGRSLNPAIDIGQIEGAFIQGYGLFTIEDIKYSPTGILLSRGPGVYKIPTFNSIPVSFNVSLLKNHPNPKAIYSSKGIGEPPLFLGVSVFFAIKDAIMAARLQSGLQDYFRLDAPATSEKIRMACADQFTKKVKGPVAGTYTPWNVQI